MLGLSAIGRSAGRRKQSARGAGRGGERGRTSFQAGGPVVTPRGKNRAPFCLTFESIHHDWAILTNEQTNVNVPFQEKHLVTSTKGQFLSVPEAGRRLGRSAASIRRLIARGTLTAIQIPGAHPRVVTAEVEAFRPAKLRSPTPGQADPARLAEPVSAA